MTSIWLVFWLALFQASYNAGILHGEWIDLDGSEDIWRRVKDILKSSSIEDAEEYAIHDHEFCGNLSEYAGVSELVNIKDAFECTSNEHIEWVLFCEFCDHIGYDINSDKLETFSDSYSGSASSLVDWCHSYLEDSGLLDSIPANLRFYFDYKAFARDMEINDVFTIEQGGGTHVFFNV